MAGTIAFNWKLVALWLAVLTAATALRPIAEDPEDPKDLFRETKLQRGIPKYKLPTNSLIPSHYSLEIQVILDEADGSDFKAKEFTALGKIAVNFQVNPQDDISEIVLNAVNITIPDETKTEIFHIQSDGSEIKVPLRANNSHVKDTTREFLTIHPDPATELKAGEKYRLVIVYEAWIMEPERLMAGLYRTSYIDELGVQQWLAVTDFESVDARRMMPCFDEPHLKATWQITAIHREKYHALSNFKEKTVTPGAPFPGWETTEFNTDLEQPLSTYLVALCVSNYEAHTADNGVLNKDVKSWGPPPLVQHAVSENTANWVAELIKAFEDKLGQEYTFPKMDSIALQDFSAGAMENWGMNTYRIVRILFLTGEGTWDDKFRMTNTISHELAHQWFGNLVTMNWWSEIWLNEGFATFMSNWGVHAFQPGYQQKDWIVIDSVQYAFLADARPTTHPLNLVTLNTPTETRNGFTTISYDKGASVIRMVHQFLGEAAFWTGVKQYLQDNKYSNTKQIDLSTALQGAAVAASVELPLKEGTTDVHYSVDEILNTWTVKSGFPYVTVSEGPGVNEIIFSQSKFKSDGTSDPDPAWIIPVTYRISTNPSTTVWLTTVTRNKTERQALSQTDYLIVNPEQHGYYRVKYSEPLRKRIYEIDATTWIDSVEDTTRSAIIDDIMNLGVSGHYEDLPQTLCILKKLKGDKSYFPWYSALTNLANVNRMLSRTGAYYNYKKFMMGIMTDLRSLTFEKQVGEEDTNLMDTVFLRNRMVEWLCRFRDADCVNHAQTVVGDWMKEGGERPHLEQPDLRPYIYCTAMAEADSESASVLEGLTMKYNDMKFETDKLNMAKAFGCSLRTDFITHILNDTLNGSGENSLNKTLSNAHKLAVFQSAVTNPTAIYTAFNFVRENVVDIVNHLGKSAFASIISSASTYLYTTTEKRWLETLLQTHADLLQSVRSSIITSINNIQANVNWHTRFYQDYRNFFMNHETICPPGM